MTEPQPETQTPQLQPPEPQPQAGQPESDMPQAGQPESDMPQAGQPESDMPQAGQPESDMPQAGQPQANQPQAGEPSTPSTSTPSTATAFSSMDASALLVRALAQLPPADRDRVYTWLLGTGLHVQPGVLSSLGRAVQAELPAGRQQDFAEQGAELVRTLFRGSPSSGQQMVPVRFSTEQHARLRAWCTEHGFSMATVIRGLVDRFLDGQQPDRR
jgi:hypothetical protein